MAGLGNLSPRSCCSWVGNSSSSSAPGTRAWMGRAQRLPTPAPSGVLGSWGLAQLSALRGGSGSNSGTSVPTPLRRRERGGLWVLGFGDSALGLCSIAQCRAEPALLPSLPAGISHGFELPRMMPALAKPPGLGERPAHPGSERTQPAGEHAVTTACRPGSLANECKTQQDHRGLGVKQGQGTCSRRDSQLGNPCPHAEVPVPANTLMLSQRDQPLQQRDHLFHPWHLLLHPCFPFFCPNPAAGGGAPSVSGCLRPPRRPTGKCHHQSCSL